MEKKASNTKPNAPKKNLITTRRQSSRIKIIITIVVLLVASLTYYLIDSGSFVATVDGNRISRAEYQYFLSIQKSETEYKEELSTQEEKDKFWMTPADGQDPWEDAKRKALDLSKEYMIQRIKAQEAGLSVNSAIKSEIDSYMTQLRQQSQGTEKQFADYIRGLYKISLGELKNIYQNMKLIETFKANYIKENYKEAAPSDSDIKAYYDKDTKKFDKVDIRYVSLLKMDDQAKELTQDKLDAKKKLAEEALSKIKNGEDIDKVIAEYSEDKPSADSTEPVGKTTLTYTQNPYVQELYDWVFNNKPGDSGLVETEFAYYVVKIEKRTTFDDAKGNVKSTMEYEAKEKFYDDALQAWGLESRYNIITNERIYDSISYK